MTEDEIIRMAKEKGFFPQPVTWGYAVITPSYDTVVRFAQMIASYEREECAKVAALWQNFDLAAAIRARGNT